MEVRFWTFHNDSKVRIKVRPGRPVVIETGGQTDEGYHWSMERLTVEGDTVTLETETDARDCDGRYSTSDRFTCRVDRMDGYVNGYGDRVPDWKRVDSSQRDYTAEAAGY